MSTSTLAAIEAAAGADGLFAGLDADARLTIEEEASWKSLQSGDVLFREGDAGDALYVVVTGRLRILVSGTSDEDIALAEVGRGEVVGEMALLTGDPRSATVVAVRDSRLVRLSRAAFERIVQQCPAAMLLVTRRLVRRLQQANRGPRGAAPLATIALIPLDPSVDPVALGHILVDALGTFGTATLVTEARLDPAVGLPARLVDGRGVRPVLGGGGARGFAHIGVIQALHEAGVPIDAIGGTSMGAVIAAQFAAGADVAALRELNRRHWVKQNPLKDKTLPVVALLA